MSTTMVRKEDVVRKWYVLDAAGKPLGKTAALAADLLRGKRKVDYTPHVDCGDFVIIPLSNRRFSCIMIVLSWTWEENPAWISPQSPSIFCARLSPVFLS